MLSVIISKKCSRGNKYVEKDEETIFTAVFWFCFLVRVWESKLNP